MWSGSYWSNFPFLFLLRFRNIAFLLSTLNNMVELRGNMLHFKQWLPDECITIEALVESSGENPELYIDEHDIINSKVIFKNSTNR